MPKTGYARHIARFTDSIPNNGDDYACPVFDPSDYSTISVSLTCSRDLDVQVLWGRDTDDPGELPHGSAVQTITGATPGEGVGTTFEVSVCAGANRARVKLSNSSGADADDIICDVGVRAHS